MANCPRKGFRFMQENNVRWREAYAWCECCEKPLFLGDYVLKDNRFRDIQVCICFQCFCDAGKKELAEMLGATFEELEEYF